MNDRVHSVSDAGTNSHRALGSGTSQQFLGAILSLLPSGSQGLSKCYQRRRDYSLANAGLGQYMQAALAAAVTIVGCQIPMN